MKSGYLNVTKELLKTGIILYQKIINRFYKIKENLFLHLGKTLQRNKNK